MVYHSHPNHQQQTINQKHHYMSVHKPPSSKKPASSAAPPSASTKPKVYHVKPIHFRELVQRLTGAASQPQPQPQRLHNAAPPPIQLACHPNNAWAAPPLGAYTNTSNMNPVGIPYQEKSTTETVAVAYSDGFAGMELSLSPSSCSWFSFPLLSPPPLSNFGA